MTRFFIALLLVLLLPVAVRADLFGSDTETRVPRSSSEIALSFAPIIKKASPAVVSIYTSARVRQRVISPFMDDPMFRRFFGGELPGGLSQERVQNALGSGVIVGASGLVVTNNHVIEGAEEINVVLADRREYKAKLITADARSDLAVLRLQAKPGEQFPTLVLKDSDDVQVGDLVLAIGNPFAVGQTVTMGIVSAVARSAEVGTGDYNYFIQTDAAINPGNSGGALLAADGQLVGIPSAIYSQDGGSLGIGFAIPANLVRTVIASAGQGGRIVRGWLGFTGQSLNADLAKSLSLERPSGVIVTTLNPKSPAAQAGLLKGDVIVAVNGKDIDDAEALRFRIATAPIDSTMNVKVTRKGELKEIPIRVIAPPEVPAREETVLSGDNPLAGLKVANLSPAVAQELGFDDEASGVVILDTSKVPSMYRMGLEKGDIFLSINKKPIKSVKELQQAVKNPIQQMNMRRGDTAFIIGVN